MGVELRTTYECGPCGQTTEVTVTDLWAGPPGASPEMSAGIVRLRAARELTFATCPRCGERNPAGIAQQKGFGAKFRVVLILGLIALGIGIWFVPALAWVFVALDALVTAIIVFAFKRTGADKGKGELVKMIVVLLGALGSAIYYPRAVAAFPAVLAINVIVFREKPDAPWNEAKRKLRFDGGA